MLKKIYKSTGVIALLLFSFYYTDRAVDIVKRNDPIMKSILQVSKEYEELSINATIENDTIIPGLNGVAVDVDSSYKKMKNIGGYYESMLVFKDVIPDESIIKTFDKFIVKGNGYKNEIALIIKITNITNINKLKDILKEKDVKATFFIDGTVIENNMELIEELSNTGFEIENYGYDLNYTDKMFNWTNNMLYSITNIDPMFCYVEYKDYNTLNLCSKNKMYTVNPTVVVTKSPFMTIKDTLEDGNIIVLNQTDDVVKELSTIVSYIRQKGYDIVTLEELISESK